jgi:hypothetical protein
VELGTVCRQTGKKYTSATDVRRLVAGFRRRAKAEGITFANKSGRGLSLARAKGATAEVFERFRDEVMNPELMQFQLLHGVKLTLSDIVNFDEYRLDLCDFAGGNVYMTLAWFGNNILVPYERSPHITVITGFAGKVHLVTMVIRIGSQFVAPHPHHAQLLPRGPGENKVLLAQSPSGWVDGRLKLAFWKVHQRLKSVCPLFLPRPTLSPRRSSHTSPVLSCLHPVSLTLASPL